MTEDEKIVLTGKFSWRTTLALAREYTGKAKLEIVCEPSGKYTEFLCFEEKKDD